MSDDGMPTADQITAEWEAGQAAQAEPVASTTADPAQAETQTESAAPVEAAPAEVAPPAALKLTDSSLVEDPADGQVRPWGEIKAERLRQADYTRKTMAVAEQQRQIEAMRQQMEAAAAAEKLRAAQASLPVLPDDDPFAQHQKLLHEKLTLAEQAIRTMQEQTAAAEKSRILSESRAALAAEEKRMTDEHGFKAREIGIVEDEYMRRRTAEPGITLQSVAKEYADYLADLKKASVEEFKNKHRVGSDAASGAVPATGTATPAITPGAPGFADKLAEAFSAIL